MAPTLRRRLLAVASVAMAGVLLTGCANGTGPSAASATAAPGGTIQFATDREPTCLDPAVGGDQPQSLIARAFLDSLTHQKADGSIEPWLAESWDISPDGLTYTFHLRDDVTFSDGTPFDAAAVKANFEYWLDPATQSSVDSLYVSDYAGTDIPDPHTAVVHLKKPYSAFIQVLSQSFLGIQSPTALKRGAAENCSSPVGSGPFIVTGWNKQQDVTLVRNPDYDWAPASAEHDGPAYADGIRWAFIAEPSTRFGALQTHEADVIETIPPESFAVAKADPNITIIDKVRPGGPVQYVFNTTRAPFDDVKVRQAFRFGADIDSGLASVYFGAYKAVGGPLSPTTVDYDKAFDDVYAHDPAKANGLLDAAGWTGRDADGYRTKAGTRLTLQLNVADSVQPSEISLLEQLQAIEKQVGFDVQINKLDSGTESARYNSWDYDLDRQYWVTNTPDVLRYQYSSAFIPSTGGYHSNGSGFSDPKLDRLVDTALRSSDATERTGLYRQAQQIVSDAAVALPVYLYPSQYAFDNTRLGGVDVDPSINQVSFYDTWVKTK
ncbi:ABC transporter substrate-binding protein [Cryobacterium tepidiphilum]|uniref:ABC transporter substrate-binding protein n=1 Tax=Cryobacterium tepidiphilum TaxID=2486026 RepID=A0A3M8LFB8_9MICO|nr:ABC transporter substrate-binding protein [Cryobacterium tepidiphilum]RNE64176.1 ABC transporter substrate-binding protein [Cryobacterium tepidiphilum]